MAVATAVQPNYSAQSASVYKAAIDALFAVGYRAMTAFAPHEQTSPVMTVRLDAGFLFDGATRTEVAAQTSATITAPVSNPRKDLIYIDKSTGAVGVVTGTEAASPAEPDCPVGKLPVAIVNLATSTTAITNTLLSDVRAVWLAGLGAAAFLSIGAAANQIPTNAMLGAAAFREVIDPAAGAIAAADAGKAIVVDAAGKYPAGDGSQLTNIGLPAPLYTSAAWTVAAGVGESNTINHALGRTPRMIQLWARVTTAHFNYSVGDEILMDYQNFRGAVSIVIDSGDVNNIKVIFDTSSPQVHLANKTTFTQGDVTMSNFEFFLKVW